MVTGGAPSTSNGTGNGNGTQNSTNQPGTPLSPIVPCFPPNVDSSRREEESGDPVRDRCRDMIYKAIKKGLVDCKNVVTCTGIEHCLIGWMNGLLT